jgi:hypothetical protein
MSKLDNTKVDVKYGGRSYARYLMAFNLLK